MGQGLRGFIEYGANGMFCVIEKPDRPALAASQWTAGDADKAGAALVVASRELDKAASKGVIHQNQAANKKSALAKAVNQL